LQPARDRQTAGIHDRRRQLGPVDGEHQTEQVAQPFAADVQLGRLEANELPLDVDAMITVLHGVTANVDDDTPISGIDRRLEPAVRCEPVADLGQLEEL